MTIFDKRCATKTAIDRRRGIQGLTDVVAFDVEMQVLVLLLDERLEQAVHEAVMISNAVDHVNSSTHSLVEASMLAKCGLSWLVAHQEGHLQRPLGRPVDVFCFRAVGHSCR